MKRGKMGIAVSLIVIGGLTFAVWGFVGLVYFLMILAMIGGMLELFDWLRLRRGRAQPVIMAKVITRDRVIDFVLLVVFFILALGVTGWFIQLNLEYQAWRAQFLFAIEPTTPALIRNLLWIPMLVLWGLVCKWAYRVF